MDLEAGKQQFISCIKKYRYVIMILLLGVVIMGIPERSANQAGDVSAEDLSPPELEERLVNILSRISGVGKVEILLTEASGSTTIYQTDSAQNAANVDTVVVTDSSRVEVGLVKQILPPVYLGAVVVCQGADSAGVRLAVVEAVKSVTGLASDRITVLKMK